MGMIAAKNADKVYITEDDPYREKAEDICEEIRAEAVKYSDDIVVIRRPAPVSSEGKKWQVEP